MVFTCLYSHNNLLDIMESSSLLLRQLASEKHCLSRQSDVSTVVIIICSFIGISRTFKKMTHTMLQLMLAKQQ
jgi:hypothetical protein